MNTDAIAGMFRLNNPVDKARALKTGLINDSYVLPAADGKGESYLLQRINHHIFRDVPALQNNILRVTEHIRGKLIAAGVPDYDDRVLRIIPAADGRLFVKCDEDGGAESYWRVYRFIGRGRSQEQVTPESAYLAGHAFGEFQDQLSDMPDGAIVESIPDFHNIEFRLRQLHEAVEADAAGRVSGSRDIIDALLSREDAMCVGERMYRAGELPKRINHCDTKVNNMLFDADGKPLCIVDLDTVMPGFVFSDFGDFMRTAANTGAEDDPDLGNIHVNIEVFRAYTEGYLERAGFLTRTERDMLPYGCRLLSYMQTVRFFTDWLNGDTYYKIQYPEHNLVRTRAQLRLLEEQEKCEDEMKRIIG